MQMLGQRSAVQNDVLPIAETQREIAFCNADALFAGNEWNFAVCLLGMPATLVTSNRCLL